MSDDYETIPDDYSANEGEPEYCIHGLTWCEECDEDYDGDSDDDV